MKNAVIWVAWLAVPLGVLTGYMVIHDYVSPPVYGTSQSEHPNVGLRDPNDR